MANEGSGHSRGYEDGGRGGSGGSPGAVGLNGAQWGPDRLRGPSAGEDCVSGRLATGIGGWRALLGATRRRRVEGYRGLSRASTARESTLQDMCTLAAKPARHVYLVLFLSRAHTAFFSPSSSSNAPSARPEQRTRTEQPARRPTQLLAHPYPRSGRLTLCRWAQARRLQHRMILAFVG